MAFTARRIRIGARVVAGLALFVGLGNSLNALGVLGTVKDPVATFGQFAFGVLVVTAVLRLFAAVGLWAYATWGAFLLLFASLIELFFAAGVGHRIVMTPAGFGTSLLLFASGIALLIWRVINKRTLLNQL